MQENVAEADTKKGYANNGTMMSYLFSSNGDGLGSKMRKWLKKINNNGNNGNVTGHRVTFYMENLTDALENIYAGIPDDEKEPESLPIKVFTDFFMTAHTFMTIYMSKPEAPDEVRKAAGKMWSALQNMRLYGTTFPAEVIDYITNPHMEPIEKYIRNGSTDFDKQRYANLEEKANEVINSAIVTPGA